jgi:HK97 family phage prohead protease
VTTIRLEGFAPQITLDAERRTIRGEITRYNQPTDDHRRIVIHDGAVRRQADLSRHKLLIDHDPSQPVGFMSELDDAGRFAAFKIPDGEAGDKALADAANGLRDGLSIGFDVPDEPGALMYDDADSTVHVYAADLIEVSLVALPAFQDARVTGVAASRALTTEPNEQENPTMGDTLTQDDLDAALTRQHEDLTREFAAQLAAFRNPRPTGPRYASFGAFLKKLASGDNDAADFYRQRLAYTGGTTDDTAADDRPTWVNDALHLINTRRRVINAFTRETLPADGMTLDYLVIETNSITIGKQAAEGDALGVGKITFDAKNVPVETYGGASEVSRQIIDRASVPYLNTLGTAMDLEYARQTELAVRAVLKAALTAQAESAIEIASLDFEGVTDALVDAAELFDTRSFALTGGYCSKDVFKALKNITDSDGDPLMLVQGEGVNQVGTISVPGLSGSIANVPFWMLPGADAGTFGLYDPLALTTWESAAAPFQLQEDDALDLTRAYSKYGYLAVASQYPQALVPVTLPAGN